MLLSPDVERWFYCGSDWGDWVFVVYVDFIEKTLIPEHSFACNLLRGVRQRKIDVTDRLQKQTR